MKLSKLWTLIVSIVTLGFLVSCSKQKDVEVINEFGRSLEIAAMNHDFAKGGLRLNVQMLNIDDIFELNLALAENVVATGYENCGLHVKDRLSSSNEKVILPNGDEVYETYTMRTSNKMFFPTNKTIIEVWIAEAIKKYTPEQKQALKSALDSFPNVICINGHNVPSSIVTDIIDGIEVPMSVSELSNDYIELSKELGNYVEFIKSYKKNFGF